MKHMHCTMVVAVAFLLALPHVTHALPKKHIRQLYLLGERNSGTNFIERTLHATLDHSYGRGGNYPLAQKIPVFKFKHMWTTYKGRFSNLTKGEIQKLAQNHTALYILVVRNPCDWIDGMYRHPWHLCPIEKDFCKSHPYTGQAKQFVKNKSLSEFMTSPWHDYMDKSQGFANIFELRKVKLGFMIQLQKHLPHNTAVLHLKNFELNPISTVDQLVKRFSLKKQKMSTKREKVKVHKPLCLTQSEWKIAEQGLDWEAEKLFGFTPADCYTCPFL